MVLQNIIIFYIIYNIISIAIIAKTIANIDCICYTYINKFKVIVMSFCEICDFGSVLMHHSLDDGSSVKIYEKHCHSNYEIIYTVSGKGKYVAEGAVYDLLPNTLAFIPPCEFHYVDTEPSVPYERYVIYFFDSDIAKSVRDSVLFFGERGLRYFRCVDSFEFVKSTFEKLSSFDMKDCEKRILMAQMLLSEILLYISDAKHVSGSRREEKLGARVVKYLNEHITSPLTLDGIAKEFFVSKSYLCRAFKEYNGVSVLEYINGKRVAMAKQMIERGESALNASYSVGFSDYSTFFRAYKRTVGKSPKHNKSNAN